MLQFVLLSDFATGSELSHNCSCDSGSASEEDRLQVVHCEGVGIR